MDTIEQSVELLRAFAIWHNRLPSVTPGSSDARFIELLPISGVDIPRAIEGGMLRVVYPSGGPHPMLAPARAVEARKGVVPVESELNKLCVYIEMGFGNRVRQAPGTVEQKSFTVFHWGSDFTAPEHWRARAYLTSFSELCDLILMLDRQVFWHVTEG